MFMVTNHQSKVRFRSLQVYIYTAVKELRLMAAQGQKVGNQSKNLRCSLEKVSSKVRAVSS